MEAKALHDFKASSKDELSFDKGSIVKVSTTVCYRGRAFKLSGIEVGSCVGCPRQKVRLQQDATLASLRWLTEEFQARSRRLWARQCGISPTSMSLLQTAVCHHVRCCEGGLCGRNGCETHRFAKVFLRTAFLPHLEFSTIPRSRYHNFHTNEPHTIARVRCKKNATQAATTSEKAAKVLTVFLYLRIGSRIGCRLSTTKTTRIGSKQNRMAGPDSFRQTM
jgi:hypothetical protein